MVYYFMQDNFIIINEQETTNFNTRVMKIFKKYNRDTFHLSFIDCSLILLFKEYNLDFLVSFDKWFEKVEEIETFNL